MLSATRFLLLASLVAYAAGADHQVMVGASGLSYTPNSVTAAAGDTVTFIWETAIPHTVSQSSFGAPCSELSGGFDSGSVTASSSSPVSMVVTVSGTDPIWFFCKTSGHCSSGMGGVINPPANETIDAFLTAARGTSGAGGSSSFVGTGVGASAAALVTGPVSSGGAASSTSAPASSASSAPASSGSPTATGASTSAPAAATSAKAGSGSGYGNAGGKLAVSGSLLAVVGVAMML